MTQHVFSPGLYVITDRSMSRGRTHVEVAESALAAGASAIQLRDKTAALRSLSTDAVRLREITRSEGVSFIVNDYVDLALAVGADGVHLGQDDLPLPAARRVAGTELIIGKSTHTLEQAIEAEQEGADYIAIGPVFATGTKRGVPPVGTALVAEVCRRVTVPVVAIGGIKVHNISGVIAAGAAGAAVVSEVVSADDPEMVCRRLIAEMERARCIEKGGNAAGS